MQKIGIYTTERALNDAQQYIIDNDIVDEDNKQNLYLAALEFCNARNNGYKYSFSKFVERPSTKKMIDEFTVENNEEKRVPIEQLFYDPNMEEVEAADVLLRNINSRLTEREQKILYLYIVNDMTKADISKLYNVTRDRICQILAKSFRKLRCPSSYKDILEANIESASGFEEKFTNMLNGLYEPPKRVNKIKNESQQRQSEKMVFYTKAELEAKRMHEEYLRTIKTILENVNNCDYDVDAAKYIYSLNNLNDINKIIDQSKRLWIPKLRYLGIMDNKKYFEITFHIMKCGIEAHTEGNELVITGDDTIHALLKFHKDEINIVLNYIIRNYDNFN